MWAHHQTNLNVFYYFHFACKHVQWTIAAPLPFVPDLILVYQDMSKCVSFGKTGSCLYLSYNNCATMVPWHFQIRFRNKTRLAKFVWPPVSNESNIPTRRYYKFDCEWKIFPDGNYLDDSSFNNLKMSGVKRDPKFEMSKN